MMCLESKEVIGKWWYKKAFGDYMLLGVSTRLTAYVADFIAFRLAHSGTSLPERTNMTVDDTRQANR